jgi:hypothetical protein
LLAVSFIKQRFSQQLLDILNDRSCHTQPTPRGGRGQKEDGGREDE